MANEQPLLLAPLEVVAGSRLQLRPCFSADVSDGEFYSNGWPSLYVFCFTLSKLLVSNSFDNLNHTSFYGLLGNFSGHFCAADAQEKQQHNVLVF